MRRQRQTRYADADRRLLKVLAVADRPLTAREAGDRCALRSDLASNRLSQMLDQKRVVEAGRVRPNGPLLYMAKREES